MEYIKNLKKDMNEEGMTTAELLGNAALGVAALAVIWVAIGGIGEGVIEFIKTTIGIK